MPSVRWRRATAALFEYARDRHGEHPQRAISSAGAGILQADAHAGFNGLYDPQRRPGPVTDALCWSDARRKFFALAELATDRRKKNPLYPSS